MKMHHLVAPMRDKKVSESLTEALARYEGIREQVYSELKVRYTQKTISNKILKRNGNNVELLFYHDSDEDGYGDLASSTIEHNSVSPKYSPVPGSQVPGKKSATISKYLALEAECSEEEDEDGIDDESLDDMIDDSCDSSIDLSMFVQERCEREEEVLRNLEKRFARPKRILAQNDGPLDAMHSDSSTEFPEIHEMECALENHVQDTRRREFLDFVGECGALPENEQLFNNDQYALERLSRKEEERCRGFFEQKYIG